MKLNLSKTKGEKNEKNKSEEEEKEEEEYCEEEEEEEDDSEDDIKEKIKISSEKLIKSKAIKEEENIQYTVKIKQENKKSIDNTKTVIPQNIKENISDKNLEKKDDGTMKKNNDNNINSIDYRKKKVINNMKEIQTKIKINTRAKIINQNKSEHQTAYVKKLIEEKELKENQSKNIYTNNPKIDLKKSIINQNNNINKLRENGNEILKKEDNNKGTKKGIEENVNLIIKKEEENIKGDKIFNNKKEILENIEDKKKEKNISKLISELPEIKKNYVDENVMKNNGIEIVQIPLEQHNLYMENRAKSEERKKNNKRKKGKKGKKLKEEIVRPITTNKNMNNNLDRIKENGTIRNKEINKSNYFVDNKNKNYYQTNNSYQKNRINIYNNNEYKIYRNSEDDIYNNYYENSYNYYRYTKYHPQNKYSKDYYDYSNKFSDTYNYRNTNIFLTRGKPNYINYKNSRVGRKYYK